MVEKPSRNVARVVVFVWFGLVLCVANLAVGASEVADETPVVDVPPRVVTVTRTEHDIDDVPASVDLYLFEDVIRLNAIALDELFRYTSGVDMQGSGVPGSEIKLNFRGLTPGYQSKRLLVLMDGRRINDQYQGNVDFSLLPADAIEQIEVLRGPASALYGSNAEGGIISITTRRGYDEPGTRLRAEGGSYDTQHYGISHGGVAGSLDYFAAGSYVSTDGYTDNSDGTDRDWQAWNVLGNVGWRPDADSDLRAFVGAYGGQGTDENSEREAEKNHQSVVYNRLWNERLDARLKAQVYRSYEHHEYDWKYPGTGIYRQLTWAGDVQQSLWLGERNQVTAGLELRQDGVDIDEVAGPIDESTTVTAGYLQDEVHLADSLRIAIGVRDDYNSDFGNEASPRVGGLWQPGADTDFFGSVNYAHRAPGLSDRFVRTQFSGRVFEGNPDLDPETLTAYELGMRQRVGSQLQVELTGFYNDLEDGFDFIMDPDGVFRVRNVTRMVTSGVEAAARCRLTSLVSAFASYTYTHGEYDEFPQNPGVVGNQLAYLAEHKGTAGLEFNGQRTGVHTVAVRAVGPRYGDAQNTQENRMGEYAVMDLCSRVPVAGGASVMLRVNNLFDKGYQEFPGLDQPGRNYRVGVEFAF